MSSDQKMLQGNYVDNSENFKASRSVKNDILVKGPYLEEVALMAEEGEMRL